MDEKWEDECCDYRDLDSVIGGDPIFSQTK